MRTNDVVADKFEIERVAGSGGMGTVYRARDRTTNQPVALKVMANGRDSARFLREAELLATLDHPGIVRHVAHGVDGDYVFIAMEWLEGEDLAARLERSALEPSDGVRLILRVAEALAFTHARGIIHRDIKPANIFLASGDPTRPKLLDFGIARLGARVTRTGVVLGTPGYLAPEQARGKAEIRPSADVFALGCILFECLTGRPAFVGDHPIALLAKILLEDSPRPSALRKDVPRDLDDLAARMLAKDEGERPVDGAAVARELEVVLANPELAHVTSSPATTLAKRTALTTSELRVLCVVVIRPRLELDDPYGATRPGTVMPEWLDRVRESGKKHRMRVEPLADGSIVAVADGGEATDTAARAAWFALDAHSIAPEAAIGLVTGRAEAEQVPVGDVLGAAVHRAGVPSRIQIDKVSEHLLDARFEVRDSVLVRERMMSRPRTLLGRAMPCVGREREMGTLAATFEGTVLEGTASCVLVTGPAGIGKSRVREELVQRIRGHDPLVLSASGNVIAHGTAFGLIAQPLRERTEEKTLDGRRRKLDDLVAKIAKTKRERARTFLGELVGVPLVEETPELALARRDGIAMGDQIRLAWQDFIESEAGSRPVLLVLEDLQWGDLPSVTLVDVALRNLRDRPWMVLALARPEVEQRFPGIWHERGLQHIRMPELGTAACRRLVRTAMPNLSDDEAASIAEQSAGNAFVLEELVRARSEAQSDVVPDAVVAMVQARLESMPADLRRALRAASVFGDSFSADAVRTLLGADGSELLAELVRRELVHETEPEHFRFRHGIVREAAYAMLTPADRVLGHRLAASWLQHGDPVVLASHFELGEQGPLAAPHWLRAAQQAFEGNDFALAIEHAERGVRCDPNGPNHVALRFVQMDAHRWRAELDRVLACAIEIEHAYPVGTFRWFGVARALIFALGNSGRTKEALERIESLATHLDLETCDAEGLVATLAASAGLSFMISNMSRAGALLDLVMRVEHRCTTSSSRAWLERARVVRSWLAGDHAELAFARERASKLFALAGDIRYAALERSNAGDARKEVGDYPAAEAHCRAGLVDVERLGFRMGVAMCKNNLAFVLARRGQLDEAAKIAASAIAEVSQLPRDRAYAWMYSSAIRLARGEAALAYEHAKTAVDAFSAIGASALPLAQAHLAQAELALGKNDDALTHARAALEAVEKGLLAEEGEFAIRLAAAEANERLGHHDEAGRIVREAKRRLLEAGDKISDAPLRATYLAIHEHARILAWAD